MRHLVAAELIKLTRQRQALFWGFLFVPLFMMLLGFLLGGGLIAPPKGALVSEIQPLRSLTRALNVGGNPIAQLFYATGAAAIFAIEYRYSGWRHLVPRASRERLILAKYLGFAAVAAISLALVIFGDALVTLLLPFLQGVRPVLVDAPGAATAALLTLCIALAELLTLGAIVLLVAVATRSTMAAILVPFLLALISAGAEAYLGGGDVPLPIFAGDALRTWAVSPTGTPAHSALLGLATLTGWTVAAVGLAIGLFRRQDLVSE